jgi:hypothetical protein
MYPHATTSQQIRGIWFQVEVGGGAIVVSSDQHEFEAVYYKPLRLQHLALRKCKFSHHTLVALAWEAANATTRQLGWISTSQGS